MGIGPLLLRVIWSFRFGPPFISPPGLGLIGSILG